MSNAKNVTKRLEKDKPVAVKGPQAYKIITSEVKVSFTKDSNKTLTIGLVAEVNDTPLEDVNDLLFNECLEEAGRLLKKVGEA